MPYKIAHNLINDYTFGEHFMVYNIFYRHVKVSKLILSILPVFLILCLFISRPSSGSSSSNDLAVDNKPEELLQVLKPIHSKEFPISAQIPASAKLIQLEDQNTSDILYRLMDDKISIIISHEKSLNFPTKLRLFLEAIFRSEEGVHTFLWNGFLSVDQGNKQEISVPLDTERLTNGQLWLIFNWRNQQSELHLLDIEGADDGRLLLNLASREAAEEPLAINAQRPGAFNVANAAADPTHDVLDIRPEQESPISGPTPEAAVIGQDDRQGKSLLAAEEVPPPAGLPRLEVGGFSVDVRKLETRASGVTVELVLTNEHGKQARRIIPGELFAVVVDGAYVVPADFADSSPALASEQIIQPGANVSGHLRFNFPESGDMELLFFTKEAVQRVDLTPDLQPPTAEPPLRGPLESSPLRASLYGVRRGEFSDSQNLVLITDLELALIADDPLTQINYDPTAYVRLIDEAGRSYKPVTDGMELTWPLKSPTLWANQPTRGELAFDLGDLPDLPTRLTLEVYGGVEPIRFDLPVTDHLSESETSNEVETTETTEIQLAEPPPPDTDPIQEPPEADEVAEEAEAIEVEPPAPEIAEPWTDLLTSDGLVRVTLAKSVEDDGTPLELTQVFNEDADRIYLAFKSEASRSKRLDIRFIVQDAEGFEKGIDYADGSLRIEAGAQNYFYLTPSREGFVPGTYIVEIKDKEGTSTTIPLTIESKFPWAAPVDEQETINGYNIALAALGGRIVRQSSQYDDTSWAAVNLIDGKAFDRTGNGDNCESCGWSSQGSALPQEIVLGFHERREAALGSIILDPTAWETLENPDRMPKHVEVWVSSEEHDEDYTLVASARLRPELMRQAISMPDGTRARYLKLRITANFGGSYTQVGEVQVFEANSEQYSILSDATINLARPELGGVLVRLTSSKRPPHLVRRLTDGIVNGPAWRSWDDYLPQDFTFAFNDDAAALIESVHIGLPANEDSSTWPRRVALLLSERHPLDGFTEVGTFELMRQPGIQEIPVGREARFLKLRLLENSGGPFTSLSEVAIMEGHDEGYVPLHLREDAILNFESKKRLNEEIAESEDIIPEAEPNDNLNQANFLPMDVVTRGVIDPLGEADVFALDPAVADALTLTVRLAGEPNVRTFLALLNPEGQEVKRFDPGVFPANEVTRTWKLSGQERFLRLTEPAATVVLVWDTSGSMEGRTADLEKAVRAYIEQAPASQRIGLVRFSEDVEVLLDGFTSDKKRLLAALIGEFSANGGTSFYDALNRAMELLDDVTGNKAILVMSDGADSASDLWHGQFWNILENTRVRLYTIGLGGRMRDYNPVFGTTGKRILDHVSLATNGYSFLAKESAELETFYAGISAELQRISTYRLKPTIGVGIGRLDVVATGEQIGRVSAPRVQLILDASGSMRERKRRVDGRLKIDVAKDVLTQVVQGLPDGSEVALRVYGRTVREGQPGDCKDTELLYPFQPLQREFLLEQIVRIKALGTTPLTYAMEEAARDFGNAPGERVIVLVTDGKEECGGDPAATVAKLIASGLDVRINVVGFALTEESIKATMAEIAEITGGRFFDASNGQDLISALQAAMAAPFTLEDAAGQAVASGTTGGPAVDAPPGVFTLRVAAVGEPITVRDVEIRGEHATRVALKKAGQEVAITIDGPIEVKEAAWLGANSEKQTETPERCAPIMPSIGQRQRVRRIQEKLTLLGYDPGPADNDFGDRTEIAIRAFEADSSQPAAGHPTASVEALLDCALDEVGAWQEHVIARSEKHGLAVLAEYTGTEWCADRVRLRFEALDPSLFSGSEISELQKKISQVIAADCPEAALIETHGYAKGENEMLYESTHSMK